MTKTIHLMVGVPRSGKSTYRKENKPISDYICICPDNIRLCFTQERFNPKWEPAIWPITYHSIEQFFKLTDDIVIDATNVTPKARKPFFDLADELIAYVFYTPKNICIQRAKDTKQKDLIPVIERMWNNLSAPTKEEGFKKIIEIEFVPPKVSMEFTC